MVEAEEAFEVLLEPEILAVERFEDTDGRCVAASIIAPSAESKAANESQKKRYSGGHDAETAKGKCNAADQEQDGGHGFCKDIGSCSVVPLRDEM